MMPGGVLLVLCSTMLCIHNAFIYFIYISANDAGGAGGVMTPGLLTHPPPSWSRGSVMMNNLVLGRRREGNLKDIVKDRRKHKCEYTFFCVQS